MELRERPLGPHVITQLITWLSGETMALTQGWDNGQKGKAVYM